MIFLYAQNKIDASHLSKNIALFFTFCGKTCGKPVDKSQYPVDKFVEKSSLLTPCGKVVNLSTGYPQAKPSYPHFCPQGKPFAEGDKTHFSTVSTGPTTTTTILFYL